MFTKLSLKLRKLLRRKRSFQKNTPKAQCASSLSTQPDTKSVKPASIPQSVTTSFQSFPWGALPFEVKVLIMQQVIELELRPAQAFLETIAESEARDIVADLRPYDELEKRVWPWQDIFNFLCVAAELRSEATRVVKAMKEMDISRKDTLHGAFTWTSSAMLTAICLEDLADQLDQTQWVEVDIYKSVYAEELGSWNERLVRGQAVRPFGGRVIFYPA